MSGCRIALMAKAPVPGLAKTRLAGALGPEGAAALAGRLLAHAVAQAVAAELGPVTLWAAPDASHPAFLQAREQQGVELAVQAEGDLGTRMTRVCEAAFAQAPTPTLLIGTDTPGLDAALLRQAASALESHAIVFVPALDGGYALVGLCEATPALLQALFEGMAWSTPQVMAQTRRRLASAGFAHAELPPVADIDEPSDLVHLPASWGAPAKQLNPAEELAP